jgi:ABC-type branched-subunit amino acid transport system ATPase component
MEKILEVNSLSYHYGAIHALKNISLIVNKGEIVAK